MDKQRIKDIVETTVEEIEDEFRRTQGMILTEDDLKAIIFRKLSVKYPELVKPQRTKDTGILAPMLHTELSWYDENDKLTIKPDITILEPKHLSILKGVDGMKLPSKQYSFGGNAVLLELKFIKRKKGIIDRDLTIPPQNTIKGDLEKIRRLFRRLEDRGASYKVFCYFIIFNKTDLKCEGFLQLIQTVNDEDNDKYKMIYATGNVQF